MLIVAYLAALVIGVAAYGSGPGSVLARAAPPAVGALAAAAGVALAVDARAEGHALAELLLPLLLAAGGMLLLAGSGLRLDLLRASGFALTAAAAAVPSTLTLALPLAALAAGALRVPPRTRAVRPLR